MNLYETLFLLDLFILIGILLYRLFTIMRLGHIKNDQEARSKTIIISVLTFISAFFVYAFGFVITILQPEILLYTQLFKLTTWVLVLNTMLFIVEIIFFLSSAANSRVIKPFMSNRNT